MSEYCDKDGNAIDTTNWPEHFFRFCDEVLEHGYAIRMYSPRFWMGKECPAIVGDDLEDMIRATSVAVAWDQLGLQMIMHPRER